PRRELASRAESGAARRGVQTVHADAARNDELGRLLVQAQRADEAPGTMRSDGAAVPQGLHGRKGLSGGASPVARAYCADLYVAAAGSAFRRNSLGAAK